MAYLLVFTIILSTIGGGAMGYWIGRTIIRAFWRWRYPTKVPTYRMVESPMCVVAGCMRSKNHPGRHVFGWKIA